MNGDPNITDLLRQLRDDTTALVREEVNLAKTEAKEKLKVAGRSSGIIGAGAVLGFSGLLLVLMSLGYLLREVFRNAGMSEAIATFLGFLIVGALVAGIAAVMITKGLKSLTGDSLAPQRTTRSLREDKEWVQRKASS
jgi:drug/metabolite transporter (DMT)-like permease